MKRYYQITSTIDPKVIGRSSGPYTVKITSNEFVRYKATTNKNLKMYFAHKDTIYKNLPEPLFGYLEGKKSCIDYMDCYPFFLSMKAVVSSRVKRIFENLNINKTEYILKPITLRGAEEQYYLLFIPIIPDTELIYSKTLFENVSDKNDVKMFKDSEELHGAEKLYIAKKAILPRKYSTYKILDVQATFGPFFSEDIINAFEEEGIVGYDVIRGGCFYYEIDFE